eukprot:gb/GECG01010486.1/.p1 GENE.gb/GECG01010486.1/~~gb/GECG01010486.1/.p1  ORF type:complete len:251 (+),score=34.47 gb/GECG01010486.1/:1-753(+)
MLTKIARGISSSPMPGGSVQAWQRSLWKAVASSLPWVSLCSASGFKFIEEEWMDPSTSCTLPEVSSAFDSRHSSRDATVSSLTGILSCAAYIDNSSSSLQRPRFFLLLYRTIATIRAMTMSKTPIKAPSAAMTVPLSPLEEEAANPELSLPILLEDGEAVFVSDSEGVNDAVVVEDGVLVAVDVGVPVAGPLRDGLTVPVHEAELDKEGEVVDVPVREDVGDIVDVLLFEGVSVLVGVRVEEEVIVPVLD